MLATQNRGSNISLRAGLRQGTAARASNANRDAGAIRLSRCGTYQRMCRCSFDLVEFRDRNFHFAPPLRAATLISVLPDSASFRALDRLRKHTGTGKAAEMKSHVS